MSPVPSNTMVKMLFQQEEENSEVGPRAECPMTVVTDENVQKFEKLVLADRRNKLWLWISGKLQVSKERAGEISYI